jgi:DNA-binding NtrC family response regulator
MDLVGSGSFDFILFDIAMTGLCAADFLIRLSSLHRHPPVFILSREYSFQFLDFAHNCGVVGYFLIPYSIDRLSASIHRFFEGIHDGDSSFAEPAVADSREVASEGPTSYGSLSHPDSAKKHLERTLLGKSPLIENVRSRILKYRHSLDPVLITGETGSGKDLVARLVHRNSSVSSGPFTAQNMSCVSSSLAESQLFGSVPGGFTDARANPGVFERADGGTLFLDEIGELDSGLQPKLLRVLEDGEVMRLGAAKAKKVHVRLICATNRNLSDDAKVRLFRADLLYRIDVLRLELPPLRDRPEDIPVLAASFLSKYRKRLSLGALDKMQRHDWPGNVRSLFGCLARAAGESTSEVIQPGHILF